MTEWKYYSPLMSGQTVSGYKKDSYRRLSVVYLFFRSLFWMNSFYTTIPKLTSWNFFLCLHYKRVPILFLVTNLHWRFFRLTWIWCNCHFNRDIVFLYCKERRGFTFPLWMQWPKASFKSWKWTDLCLLIESPKTVVIPLLVTIFFSRNKDVNLVPLWVGSFGGDRVRRYVVSSSLYFSCLLYLSYSIFPRYITDLSTVVLFWIVDVCHK